MKRLLLFGLFVILFTNSVPVVEAANGLVPKNALPSLMIGPKDIPWDVILFDFWDGNGKKNPSAIAGSSSYTEDWSGPPLAGSYGHRAYGVNITVYILPNPADAAKLCQKIVHSMSAIIPESYDKTYRTFSDRAWPHIGTALSELRFCKRNVTVDMYISYLGKDISGEVIRICRLLGRKIDAAASGHPAPIPTLPLVNENVHIGWRYPSVNKMLTMPAKNTIVIKYPGRDPVTAYAMKLYDGDYMVNLEAIALAVGGIKYITADLNKGKAIYNGREMRFKDGDCKVKFGNRSITLKDPVEIRPGGSIKVPVSFIEKITGKRPNWKRDDKIMVATL